MKSDFFTLGGRFLWNDVFYYQGWKIQRRVHKNHYRLLDSHNIRRKSGTFEVCKDTLLKYIAACEIREPSKDIVILIHGFGRTQKSLKPLETAIREKNLDTVIFNYSSFSLNLKSIAEMLLAFTRNFTNSPRLYFVTVGAGCLVLRKLFGICDNYRELNIKGIININPLNSGSDFAFLVSRVGIFRKIFGPMLTDITPDMAIKISKIPQDIPFYIIFSPSKLSVLTKRLFAKFDSFPQLSPPAESAYSQNIKEIQALTYSPLKNENMRIVCVEILEELVQNSPQTDLYTNI